MNSLELSHWGWPTAARSEAAPSSSASHRSVAAAADAVVMKSRRSEFEMGNFILGEESLIGTGREGLK